MHHHLTTLVLGGSLVLLASACATKGFVREQVGTTETRLSQRVDTQESQLRETAERTAAHAKALDETGQRVQGLDTRVGEVGNVAGEARTMAGEARKEAEAAAQAQREAEERLNQRFAGRNRYATVDTKLVFFDFNRADLRDEVMGQLEEVARALQADPNAVLELQGFADPRGSDRYNYQLTRERVDAVTRFLVQRHGIEPRRIHAVGMGKAQLEPGAKPTRDTMAKARRVEIRLVAPQS
jgi:outer membrane protein OmpA-like peptidoglycan-associated protein